MLSSVKSKALSGVLCSASMWKYQQNNHLSQIQCISCLSTTSSGLSKVRFPGFVKTVIKMLSLEPQIWLLAIQPPWNLNWCYSDNIYAQWKHTCSQMFISLNQELLWTRFPLITAIFPPFFLEFVIYLLPFPLFLFNRPGITLRLSVSPSLPAFYEPRQRSAIITPFYRLD